MQGSWGSISVPAVLSMHCLPSRLPYQLGQGAWSTSWMTGQHAKPLTPTPFHPLPLLQCTMQGAFVKKCAGGRFSKHHGQCV